MYAKTFLFLLFPFLILPSVYAQNQALDPPYTQEELQSRSLDVELAVGKTSSSYQVGPSGAFQYSVPIQVPKGTRGMEPKISLNYSSQAGNGLLGFGWGISGLSIISRVNRDHFHEGQATNVVQLHDDPMAWDGNRLVAVQGAYGLAGTQYKTEAETFTLITQQGVFGKGADWILIETKEGMLLEFGRTPDSKVMSFDGKEIMAWKINKSSDRFGNYIQYEYQVLSGEHLIKEISYTGNSQHEMSPYAHVHFSYVEREDQNILFASEFGQQIIQNHLLNEIEITYGESNESFKRYEFKYSQPYYSYLNEILEFGKLGSSSHYNGLRFSYSDAAHAYSEQITGIVQGATDLFPGDFNGDGLDDLLRAYKSFQNGVKQYHAYDLLLNSSTGFQAPIALQLPTGKILQASMNAPIVQASGLLHFGIGDYNGDGLSDILIAQAFDTPNNLHLSSLEIWHSQASGQHVQFQYGAYPVPNQAKIGPQNALISGDFNGDGAEDIYLNLHDGHKADFGVHIDNQYFPVIYMPRVSANPMPIHGVPQTENHSFSSRDLISPMDLNGDSKTNLMQIYTHPDDNTTKIKAYEYYAPGYFLVRYLYIDDRGSSAYSNFPNRGLELRFGDFNGDGKTDILSSSKSDMVNWTLHLSSGKHFMWTNNLQIFARNFGEHLKVNDFNGDGLSDIFVSTYNQTTGNTSLDLSYSKGAVVNRGIVFETAGNTYLNAIQGSQSAFVLDYDGDGAAELLTAPNILAPLDLLNFNQERGYGQLNGISTGMNEYTAVNYASISDHSKPCRGLYQKGNQDSYPLVEFHKPLFVVESIRAPDGSGKNSSSSNQTVFRYYYQAAKWHRQGKGLLGFEKVSFDQIQLDGQNNSIFFAEDQYDFDRQFFFSRLIKSHLSLVAYDNYVPNDPQSPPPCASSRGLLKNMHSKELTYTSIALPHRRFINQFDHSLEGDNLLGYTMETAHNYTAPQSSEHGNPNQVSKIRAKGNAAEQVTQVDLIYGQFGTFLPNAILERKETQLFGTQTPFVKLEQYSYDPITGVELSARRLDPNNQSLVLEKNTTYSSNFGLPIQVETNVPGHSNSIRTRDLEYDSEGRFVIKETNPIGEESSYEFEGYSGNVIHYDDPLSSNPVREYEYDDFHRLAETKDEYGNRSFRRWGFDIMQQGGALQPEAQLYFVEVESPGFSTQKQWFDAQGKLRKQESDGFNQKVYALYDYTSKGKIKRSASSFFMGQLGHSMEYEYDAFERLIAENRIDANGTLLQSTSHVPVPHTGISQPYNYTNREIQYSSMRADGFATGKKFDAGGRLIESQDPAGLISFEYNAQGQVRSTKVNGETLNQMQYDLFGNQTHLIEMNSGTTLYQYNILGELIYSRDARGNQVDYLEYDALGRLLRKQVSDVGGSNQSYEYEYGTSGNAIGQMIRAEVLGGISYAYGYDAQGALIYEEENLGGRQYIKDFHYDSKGRLTAEKNRNTDSKKNYKYNSISMLNEISIEAQETEKKIFQGQNQNQFGQWTSSLGLAGLACLKTFDDYGNPTSMLYPGLLEESYGVDPVSGNLDFRENVLTSKRESFSYDGLDRLSQVDLNGQTNQRLNYTSNGNISKKTGMGDYSYHVSKKHALTEIDNGSAAVNSSQQIIEFNAEQSPKSIRENDLDWQYEYGPFHQRKILTQFNRTTGNKTSRHYLSDTEYEYDRNMREKWQVEYLAGSDGITCLRVQENDDLNKVELYGVQQDYLGSWIGFSDENAQAVFQQSFDAWGKDRDPGTWEALAKFQTQRPDWLWRGYTGHEHLTEFQLIHMNGRIQDPNTARMLSPDNVVADPGNSQSYNRYAYVNNNPLKFTDPDGEAPVAALILGAGLGAYLGGTVYNQGNYNPTEWNYQSGRTWGYMVAGAVVGAASVHLAFAVATSGIPLANTAAIATASSVSSTGTHLYTGGKTDVIVGFGAASFNFSANEWGYLGKAGNSDLENIGYGFGALANVQDLFALNSGTNIDYNSLKDPVGHGSITNEKGTIDISKGFEEGNMWWNGKGTKWGTAPKSDLFPQLRINNVNENVMTRMTKNIALDKGLMGKSELSYGLLGNTCASQCARALWAAGVWGVNPVTISPHSLYLQLLVRQTGFHASPFLIQMP